jgi:hypothetical protein
MKEKCCLWRRVEAPTARAEAVSEGLHTAGAVAAAAAGTATVLVKVAERAAV